MMERESFVNHRNYLKDVPPELYDKFSGIINRYGFDGIEPDFSDKPETERWLWTKIWNSIRERIDADCVSYLTTTEKRKLMKAQNHWKDNRATREEIELLKTSGFDFSSGTFGTAWDNLGIPKKIGNPKNPKSSDEIPKNPSTDTDTRRLSESDSLSLSVSDSLSVSESECVSVSDDKTHTPTLEEIKKFAVENGISSDKAEKFFSYYESTSWKAGSSRITDWKARLIAWKKGDEEKAERKRKAVEEDFS